MFSNQTFPNDPFPMTRMSSKSSSLTFCPFNGDEPRKSSASSDGSFAASGNIRVKGSGGLFASSVKKSRKYKCF